MHVIADRDGETPLLHVKVDEQEATDPPAKSVKLCAEKLPYHESSTTRQSVESVTVSFASQRHVMAHAAAFYLLAVYETAPYPRKYTRRYSLFDL